MSLDSKHPVEAKRIGTAIIAAFHRANPPLVWRFDLQHNHSLSLALQGDEGEWELGLTSPKGEFHPIARFVMREDAEQAFLSIERILSKTQTNWFRLGLKIIATLLMVGLIALLASVFSYGHKISSDISHATDSLNPTSMGSPNYPVAAPVVPSKPGTPVPADDFFRGAE